MSYNFITTNTSVTLTDADEIGILTISASEFICKKGFHAYERHDAVRVIRKTLNDTHVTEQNIVGLAVYLHSPYPSEKGWQSITDAELQEHFVEIPVAYRTSSKI